MNVLVALFLLIHVHAHTVISIISLSTQCGVIKALVRGLLKCQVREGGMIRGCTVVMYMYSSYYRVQGSVRLHY